MIDWILQWPTWMMIRVFGLASYGFLFVGVSTGITHSLPFWSRGLRKGLFTTHRWANGIGLSLGLLHGLLLVVDTYAPFTWREILIPFRASQHPVLNGFGTLAFYGLVIVLLTTDLRGILRRRIWYALHLLAYPIFAMALLHGVGVGTDTNLSPVSAGYWLTGIVVVALTLWRIAIGGTQPNANSARGRRPEARHAGSVQTRESVSQRRLGP